jgi:hypothetical protein
MLNNVSSSVFLNSTEVKLLPVISGEWNQNLFNPPYITIAGTGVKETLTPGGSYSYAGALAHPNFSTNSLALSSNQITAYYTATTSSNSPAYKAVMYVKTDNSVPIMFNAYIQGSSTQYGSSSVDVNNYGWTKVEVYAGGSGNSDTFSSLTLNLVANAYSNYPISANLYWTTPEIYPIQYSNYQYNSLWPTDAPFSYFRPGESYVPTGNQAAWYSSTQPFANSYRQVTSGAVSGFTGTFYAPTCSIVQNPQFVFISQYVPFLKHTLPTDISQYKYFVSDAVATPSISAIYPTAISTNKLIIKLNTMVTTPNISIYLNGSGSSSYTGAVPSNGVLVLYYNGTSWSSTPWAVMPQFNDAGVLSSYTTITKITVTQNSATLNSGFNTKTSTSYTQDLTRMQVVEVSPRLEIDLSSYTEDLQINKQLDSKSTIVPLSTINTDDAVITLAGMPGYSASTGIIPIFSNQSNKNASVLANMLRKNIKFYINWNLVSYSSPGSFTQSNTYIPAGVFYSDTWNESDVDTIKVQCYDVIRYLQTLPVADYVANYKTVFDIISTMLDKSGFTDYDIDSLYNVTNDPSAPMDLSYFYANSKDTTVAAALTELFLAYQIGAYIDENGIMQFLSLANILNSSTGSASMAISDSSIYESGYGVSNIGKVGKISLRYQQPKIKQSLSLQNATDPRLKKSPSFIYTTSNDQVWISGSTDSVGFNYLSASMSASDNTLSYNINDLLDAFHSFNLNNNGYVAIENEIVSFLHKEYTISNGTNSKTVSVKNDIELNSEIDRFARANTISALSLNTANITGATAGSGTITYNASNQFTVGQSVSIDGVNPSVFNTMGTVASQSSGSFTINTTGPTITATYVSGGTATVNLSDNVTVSPTGRVTNVQRGLFGTVPSTHVVLNSTLASKSLIQGSFNAAGNFTSGGTNALVGSYRPISSNPPISVVNCSVPAATRVAVYPSSQLDAGYHTYSTKFSFANTNNNLLAGGLFFNKTYNSTGAGAMNNAFFVELIQSYTSNTSTATDINNNPIGTSIPQYQYIVVVYQIVSGSPVVKYWSDVTAMVGNIVANFEQVLVKQSTGSYKYLPSADVFFQLKAVHYASDGSDGETSGEIIDVFINNARVLGWQKPDLSTTDFNNGWQPTSINTITGVPQLPLLSSTAGTYDGTEFGAYMSTSPVQIPITGYPNGLGTTGVATYIPYNNGTAITSTVTAGSIREIYATQATLKDRSTNYWHQTSTFLNGLIQNQNIFNIYQSYMMQTTPTLMGINVYDIQYSNPAATNVDILPIEYSQYYYPSGEPADNSYKQIISVDQYALSYSTLLNTGFRGKFAIANNSPYMVWLHKTPDQLNQASVYLVLWTHEIVAQSDPAIIEKVLNVNNATEVAQVDSTWIQSSSAANKMISTIANAIEGFSKDTNLKIFGNPLIQLGDIISLTYTLPGINSRLFVVQSVKHTFKDGLETDLVLNAVGLGTQY